MYLTMNRFKVKLGQETAFEDMWKNRESHLKDVEGFMGFHLLRGPEHDSHRLYASHTVWVSEEAFRAWTRSEAFRKAHAGAGGTSDMYDGGPELEIFESIQEIQP